MSNKTPLYEEHKKLGAKIIDFAGWELPVIYSSIAEEHIAVRKKSAIFDICHMGEISVKGKDSAKFLSSLIPTSMKKLSNKKSMYSCFCNEKGGIIDDLFIFMINKNEYYLVVNAATIEKDFNWMKSHLSGDVVLENLSDRTSKIDIQGPLSKEILKKIISDSRLDSLERFSFDYFDFNGSQVMISNTGYTGEAGYEIFSDNISVAVIWNSLLEAGRPYGLVPAGLGARDTLRLEASYSLYGHELNDEITPVEAGLKWLVSSEEEYIAKKIVVKQKENGAPREMICIELVDRGVPRDGYRIEKNGEDIGYATSGTFSPSFNKGIAMALVKTGSTKPGDEIDMIIREKKVKALVVKRPFYKFNG